MIHPETIRSDFPVFGHHPALAYLDSAATSLKPRVVIEKELEYLEKYPANISRGLYWLSERATQEYEETRAAVARWIGAEKNEIVFTRGTTESINLLSYALGNTLSGKDSVVVTGMDHHANFLPWQALASRTGAQFKIIPVSSSGEIDQETLKSFIDRDTKIFAFPFISNVLGAIAPVRDIVDAVRTLAPEARIILDAAQAASYMTIDVKALDVDFLAFSAHKCFGPTGVGVLWGKYSLLDSLPPFQYGGDMVENAGIDSSTFKRPPYRFEAGTPNISGVIAFRAAVEYMQSIGMETIQAHEQSLTRYALETFRRRFPDSRILGPDNREMRGSLVSFSLPGIHPHDLSETLAQENICIRAGAHCAHPLHASLGIPASARMSFSIYTSEEDIDRAMDCMRKARDIFLKKETV